MDPKTPQPPDTRRPARVLLHCHDSFGLGHLRRTLTLAEAILQELPEAQVLVTSGSPCATHFALPAGIDVVKLPSVTKDLGGSYVPRCGRGEIEEVVELRTRLLQQVFETFAPTLVLVDHQALGLRGELTELLEAARARGVHTLLGIRDVIDGPEEVAAEWGVPEIRRALATLYERVFVYGVPEVFDPRVEYPVPPELRERLEFTGYVVRGAGAGRMRALPRRRPRVLVTVGGGEDGADRIERYLDLLEERRVAWDSTLVLGPLLESKRARRLKRRARLLPGIEVHTFHADLPRLLRQSDAIIAMAGYNTTAEILQSGRPAVLLPRTAPRREQLLRAERMQRLGLAAALVDPGVDELHAAIADALAGRSEPAAVPPLDGKERVARVVAGLIRGDALAAQELTSTPVAAGSLVPPAPRSERTIR